MTDASAPALPRGELCSWQWPEQDLLVITDGVRQGHNALSLPFRDATILDIESGGTVCVTGQFDTIVIDRSSFDLDWLDTALRDLLPALRPPGQVVISLDADGATGPPSPSAAELAGVRWDGLGTLNGRPCAILRPTDGPVDACAAPGVLLRVAHAAVRLPINVVPQPAGTTVGRLLEDRRRSEHALLGQLSDLVQQREMERQEHQGARLLRTVIRRSRPGRILLRTLRPVARLVRKLGHRRP